MQDRLDAPSAIGITWIKTEDIQPVQSTRRKRIRRENTDPTKSILRKTVTPGKIGDESH